MGMNTKSRFMPRNELSISRIMELARIIHEGS